MNLLISDNRDNNNIKKLQKYIRIKRANIIISQEKAKD